VSGKVVSYKPTETKEYQQRIWNRFVAEHPGFEPITGVVFVGFRAYFPIPESWSRKQKELAANESVRRLKKPDADNILKNIKDALQGVAYRDDKQVELRDNDRLYSVRPRLVIELKYARQVAEKE